MDLWITEYQTKNLSIGCRVVKTLYREKTPYQEVMVVETQQFGRMLLLDGIIQTTVEDEFVYHEMITHVGLNTLKKPRRVLVIGGGDGGTVREVLKHKSVEKVTLVEIDGKVIEAAKLFLPEISCGLDDPRAEVLVDDGIKHVKENKNTYDMIIVDSTDPIGPAVGLFGADFYKDVYNALTENGLFVAQTESPFFNRDLIPRVFADIRSIFPVARLFTANVPTYPGGLWTFSMGSKKLDPLEVDIKSIPAMSTRYYSPDLHGACLVLQPFVKELLK
ncbi:MAG: spermidine synthase [Peptococcaceae bacterium BICA1-7]|nr:MAG: spermidine synthase [Peptococcaceae bacterium BICA1-7]HBV97019.1 polyamine aminopropyltransferase [Desulfotomaculum sp.]